MAKLFYELRVDSFLTKRHI